VSQDFTPIQSTDTLAASLPVLNENLVCLLSNFSGTSFPTTNIVVGMECYRSDQQKTYRLKSTGPSVWVLVENATQTYLSQELADARYFVQNAYIKANLGLQGIGAAAADIVGLSFADNLGVNRWSINKNANQDLLVNRYDSFGTFIDTPFSIDHTSGALKHGNNLMWDAGNDGFGSGLDADLVRAVAPGAAGLAVLGAANSSAVLAAIGATNSLAQTGQIGVFFATYADIIPGYVPMTGGTIGDASSGANARANPDSFDLYIWLWNRGASVNGGRGSTGNNDWLAHKALVVPDSRGRGLVGLDYSSITGQAGNMTQGSYNSVGGVGGEQFHLLVVNEMPAHYHAAAIYDQGHAHGVTMFATNGVDGAGFHAYTAVSFSSGALGTGTYSTSAVATGVRVNSNNGLDTTYANGGGAAHNNMPPHLLVTFHLKL
jgi:hypothetical protein